MNARLNAFCEQVLLFCVIVAAATNDEKHFERFDFRLCESKVRKGAAEDKHFFDHSRNWLRPHSDEFIELWQDERKIIFWEHWEEWVVGRERFPFHYFDQKVSQRRRVVVLKKSDLIDAFVHAQSVSLRHRGIGFGCFAAMANESWRCR
jgi:hypothetical protein